MLNRTTFGRRTVAVGGNPEAARLAGIRVQRHTLTLYVLLGVCCGIAALMLVARTTTGSSTHGTLYELDAIAAVVIGGTLLSGGRGTIVGTVFGVLIFTTLSNVFTLNNLSISAQSVVKGLIIVVAVLLQQRLATQQDLVTCWPQHHPSVRPARSRESPSRRSKILSSIPVASGLRRAVLSAGVVLGTAAVLVVTRLHQQHPAARRHRAPARVIGTAPAATTPPGDKVVIGFSAPAADHGWMGAITNNAKAMAEPVPGHRAEGRRGHQRRQPADQPGRDLHQREGGRHRAAAVRRRRA